MAQGRSLKVIALISGGKDSLYSILHCLKNGHEVVALGNLHPPTSSSSSPSLRRRRRRRSSQQNAEFDSCEKVEDEDESETEAEAEDMDSFMYQTVGHSVIPLYEEALGIPLYREEITGRAVNVEREYSEMTMKSTLAGNSAAQENKDGEDEDETESMTRLLRRIMQRHPDANAVSAGAILSTYQRTRIENVAARLGLVSLAWLWMYPYLAPPSDSTSSSSSVTGLLDDMAAAGCEARIIKVASAGLEDTDDVLWGDLAGWDGRVRRTLVKIMSRFLDHGVEAAVLGEGGEYESLAVDGPRCLWKKRIAVRETVVQRGEGGVASVRIRGARCVGKEKEESTREVEDGLGSVRMPGLFDEEFDRLIEDVRGKAEETWCSRGQDTLDCRQPIRDDDLEEGWVIRESEYCCRNAWYMINCSAPDAGPSAAEQMASIVERVRSALQKDLAQQGLVSSPAPTEDIVFTTILLRSMSDFASVNAVYASLFSKPNPPARVTVACGNSLPAGISVLVSLVIDKGRRGRRHGLHVQSRSYWAPANIGPYSQAISVPLRTDTGLEDSGSVVYVAGQIPLVPATMELATPSEAGNNSKLHAFIFDAALSMQHLWRIGRVMEVDGWLGGTAFLAAGQNVSSQARIAAYMWNTMNTQRDADDEQEEDDDVPGLDAWDIKYGRQQDPNANKTVERRPLPNFSILDAATAASACPPPFFAVEVAELPRGAAIEWQALGACYQRITISHRDSGDVWVTHSKTRGFNSLIYIGMRTVAEPGDLEMAAVSVVESLTTKELAGSRCVPGSCVMYTRPRSWTGVIWKHQVVPCKSVRCSDGTELVAGIVVHARPWLP